MWWLVLLALGADESLGSLVEGDVEKVADGFKFVEGPVWTGRELLFSDIPGDTIYRPDKTVFRQPSGKSNGLALDPQGRLLACEHENRRVSRTEPDGTVAGLAETFLDKRINSPNDLIVRSDGRVYFTDPPYGLEGKPGELPFSGVYTVSPQGELGLAFCYFVKPNGITLSPDEKTLYVGDATANEIVAFDVREDGSLGNLRPFCRPEHPDGIKTDAAGNLWAACRAGIRVYAPDGRALGLIPVPEVTTNCTFGDDDLRTLYITATTGLYKVRTKTPGWMNRRK